MARHFGTQICLDVQAVCLLFKQASYFCYSFTTCISLLIVARIIAAVIIAPSDDLDLKSLGTSESSVADHFIPVLFPPDFGNAFQVESYSRSKPL